MIDRPTDSRSLAAGELISGATAVAAAAVLGVLAVVNPVLAVAALGALVAVPAATARPGSLVYLLIGAVFAESITLGGVTIGRLLAPLALIAIASHVARSPVALREGRGTVVAVGAYVLLALASLVWTIDVGGTLQALGSLAIAVVFMGAFAVLLGDERDLRRMLWVGATVSIVLAVVYVGAYLRGVERQSNPVGDPNLFAAFQVLVLPLVLVLASFTRAMGRRLVLFVGTGVIAASVIATLSRSGFATLLLMVALIVLLPARTLFRSREQKALYLLAAALGAALLLSLAWVTLQQRFQAGLQESGVAGGRGDLWQAAVQGYESHPVTGIGYGAFQPHSFRLLAQTPGVDLGSHLRFSVRLGEPVHNAYLESLTELGPSGLLLFIGILALTGRSLLRTSRRASEAGQPFLASVAKALVLGLIALAASSVVLSTGTARALWMVVGLSVALPRLVPPATD